MFVILECKLSTIIAVLLNELVVFFAIKRSTIGNFIDRCYGRQKKGPLVETTALSKFKKFKFKLNKKLN